MVSDAAKGPFSSLPAHCVRPLGALSVQALARWAEETGQHFVEIDLADARDKKPCCGRSAAHWNFLPGTAPTWMRYTTA
jgi:hypothetical protein